VNCCVDGKTRIPEVSPLEATCLVPLVTDPSITRRWMIDFSSCHFIPGCITQRIQQTAGLMDPRAVHNIVAMKIGSHQDRTPVFQSVNNRWTDSTYELLISSLICHYHILLDRRLKICAAFQSAEFPLPLTALLPSEECTVLRLKRDRTLCVWIKHGHETYQL
jgi:hypothetical protein